MRRIIINEQEKLMFLVMFFSLFFIYIIPVWANFNLDTSDMAFHIANHKAFWGDPHPFGKILDYPQLFYANPLHPLISMPLIVCVIIPLLIYFLSNEFVSRNYSPYASILWIGIVNPSKLIVYYGQIHSMIFILLFFIYWIRKNPYSPLLLLPSLYGHNGSAYLVLASCGFAILDITLTKIKSFPLVFLSLESDSAIILKNILPTHFIISLLGILGNYGLDKNKRTHILLLVCLIPSLLFNSRGFIIVSAIAVISLTKLLPYDPKLLIYPLSVIVVFSCQYQIQREVYAQNYFHSNLNSLVETHNINGSYCYYDSCSRNGWGCSHSSVWKWANFDNISLIHCTFEQYNENLIRGEQIILDKRVNLQLIKT